MNPFAYYRAAGTGDAMRELAGHDRARVIAGGTNLLDLIKEHVMSPTEVIDISRLPLSEITELEDGRLRLGALASNAATAKDPLVRSRYPLLSRAILAGASPQLRNMATDGGNLMQRTRCVYFYDRAVPCNKRLPGSGCPAIEGYNRNHGILGTSASCIATHPSDMCVALAALDAVVRLEGPSGTREIAFGDFHRLPGDRPDIETVIEHDELIVSIDLPAEGFSENSFYLKIRDRHSYAFALVSVAAALRIQDGKIQEARVALGGVAHKPWRNRDAEESVIGGPPEGNRFAAAADMILREAKGYTFNSFKIPLARQAIVRALTEAANPRVDPPPDYHTEP